LDENLSQDEWIIVGPAYKGLKWELYGLVHSCTQSNLSWPSWVDSYCHHCRKDIPKELLFQRKLLNENSKFTSK